MPRGKPVVFGEKTKPKEQQMRLKDSKYLAPKKRPQQKESNPWKEILIHESNLIVALEYAMRQTTQLKPSEIIERVLVGEPANGVYPLSVAIKKGKEE
jgi:ribonuclease HII